MKNVSFILLAFASYSYSCIAFADEEMLIGIWVGNDRASQAIYSSIEITKKEISWGGHRPNNPYCKTTYNIIERDAGETYPGNILQNRGRSFTIFKLKLTPTNCTDNHGYLQFALSSNDYAEVVPYATNNRILGWHNFSKRPKESK